MKKFVIATAAALTLATSISTPAYAAERDSHTYSAPASYTTNPIQLLIGLLLPAVQKVRA